MVPRPKRDAPGGATTSVPPSSPKRARKQAPEAHEDDGEFAVDHEELGDIMRIMGIASFSTTKNKDHSKSDCFGVMKAQTRKTRQMVKPRTGTAK